MALSNFEDVQRAVLKGEPVRDVLPLLPPGSTIEAKEACPTCNAGYVAKLPGLGRNLLCLACGLEFHL